MRDLIFASSRRTLSNKAQFYDAGFGRGLTQCQFHVCSVFRIRYNREHIQGRPGPRPGIRPALAARGRSFEDVRARKLCIARDEGVVHGIRYDIEQQFGTTL